MNKKVFMKLEDFGKSRLYSVLVIPVEAGIQLIQAILGSRLRGSDGLPDLLRDNQSCPFIFGLKTEILLLFPNLDFLR